MFKPKLIIAFLVIVLVVIGIYFLLLPEIKEKEVMKIRVGIMPIADCLQYFVAKEKGFFKEEGLEVEEVTGVGGAAIIN